ncbi:ribonuclease HI (plasmid) [Paenibacillus rhizovicinus]|uniref:Ribonuclease HI n=1 Tax=Paenibacillus rhizovicinus TaxID=2704463 RepID=A0A6C0PB99_9BACL|nr:ribonuclease H [Paenibacillus rhizovicinus]QHW35726.1 ribonuclease HI [Paenibacillus rhizovicinus]
MKDVIIDTDGACSGNPGPGGWSNIFVYPNGDEEIKTGFIPYSTNNLSEIIAVIRALESIIEPSRVLLKTDSSVVRNCFDHDWRGRWIANGWRNSKNKLVEHRPFWERLFELVDYHKVRFVKTSDADPLHKRADGLAKKAIREGLAEVKAQLQGA